MSDSEYVAELYETLKECHRLLADCLAWGVASDGFDTERCMANADAIRALVPAVMVKEAMDKDVAPDPYRETPPTCSDCGAVVRTPWGHLAGTVVTADARILCAKCAGAGKGREGTGA